MKKLYLFTGKFPYSKMTECFLEDEITYLSNRFDEITIIPLQKEIDSRKILPANCKVLAPALGNRIVSFLRGLSNWRVLKVLFIEFFEFSVYSDYVKLLNWVKCYFIACNLMNSPDIRRIGRAIKQEDVCYFYWGKWSNVLSFFWKGRSKMVSRFHGEFDLWEEVHHGYVPLREKVVCSLDAAVFISSKGEKYFKEKYPQTNTVFIPLGSSDIKPEPHSFSKTIRVLSCSNVIPLKRVELVFRSLFEIPDREIEWTHIGDGSEMNKLKCIVNTERRDNISVNLMGSMSHEDVMRYYSTHSFDVFVNLSTIEGVPVSIMEAISCNIPVVATDVGGTSEVVTKDTGLLVSSNPKPQEVAGAILKVLDSNFTPRLFWDEYYNAGRNYNRFAEYIYSL